MARNGEIDSAVAYARKCLCCLDLKLKREQIRALQAVYDGRDTLLGYLQDLASLFATRLCCLCTTISSGTLKKPDSRSFSTDII